MASENCGIFLLMLNLLSNKRAMLKRILFLGIITLTVTSYAFRQEFSIDENGTVSCVGAQPGDTGTIGVCRTSPLSLCFY
jgi:hypothetical protein